MAIIIRCSSTRFLARSNTHTRTLYPLFFYIYNSISHPFSVSLPRLSYAISLFISVPLFLTQNISLSHSFSLAWQCHKFWIIDWRHFFPIFLEDKWQKHLFSTRHGENLQEQKNKKNRLRNDNYQVWHVTHVVHPCV